MQLRVAFGAGRGQLTRVHLFITGTDTDAGKTYAAAGLIRAARAAGLDCVGVKPFCCGGREDAEALHAAAEGALPLNEVNPVWLRAPAAPYVAAMIENRPLDLGAMRESIAAVCAKHPSVVLEGAGGWRVPITRDYAMNDLAAELGWPVLVVAVNRLGALNHTLLTVESIRARGLKCAGVVLNEPRPRAEEEQIATATNREILETLAETAVWELSFGGPIEPVAPWANLFTCNQE